MSRRGLCAVRGYDLVSRERHLTRSGQLTAIDLPWRKIGKVPKDTFALAAEAGRVYAPKPSASVGTKPMLTIKKPVVKGTGRGKKKRR